MVIDCDGGAQVQAVRLRPILCFKSSNKYSITPPPQRCKCFLPFSRFSVHSILQDPARNKIWNMLQITNSLKEQVEHAFESTPCSTAKIFKRLRLLLASFERPATVKYSNELFCSLREPDADDAVRSNLVSYGFCTYPCSRTSKLLLRNEPSFKETRQQRVSRSVSNCPLVKNPPQYQKLEVSL